MHDKSGRFIKVVLDVFPVLFLAQKDLLEEHSCFADSTRVLNEAVFGRKVAECDVIPWEVEL